MIKTIVFGFSFLLLSLYVNCQGLVCSSTIVALRDSLDAVNYTTPQMLETDKWKIIRIGTQAEWDGLGDILKNELEKGERYIKFCVQAKELLLPLKPHSILNLNYPDANIKIVAINTTLLPEGKTFSYNDEDAISNGHFWSLPYNNFNYNDIIIDKSGNELPLREDVKRVSENIIKVHGIKNSIDQDDIWKFKVELPDLTEEKCKDFYVLMTRDWTSARHKVVKVQEGWLYYHLDTEDLHSDRNPNVDLIQYGLLPRYRLINNPVGKGVHYVGGRIYVPCKYKKIHINKGGYLFHMGDCHFNSFELTGFNFNGLGCCPIGVYHSTFKVGMFIHHNVFTNLSSLAVSAAWNENVVINDNTICNTRVNAIESSGKNSTIRGNHLKNIGWMLNTRAIISGGENVHICDNIIEDFNYAAIACGSRAATRDSVRLTYIIERNLIRYSKEYKNNYHTHTLADGGAIYIGPQCTRGIIRNNVIEDIIGIHSNRGIFLDDGAKNLAIYGNMIINTGNSYDIDLRYSNSLSKEIPDFNSYNCVFHNIITGGYRFEDAGANSHCIGGQNLLLGIGSFRKTKMDLYRHVKDIEIKGCKIKKGKLAMPKQYTNLLDSICVDGSVRKYIL